MADTQQPIFMYDVDQAASFLGISATQLRRLKDAGAIGYVTFGQGSRRQHVRFTRDQLLAFIATRSVEANPRTATATAAPARPGTRRRPAGKAPTTAADVVARMREQGAR